MALHILDRFHIVAKMNEALDDVRAAEYRRMALAGYDPVLKKSRWCLLKRKENLTGQQEGCLRDLLRYNLKTVRAYLLKEDFQQLWEYDSPTWAGKFLDEWRRQTMRSRIEPMKKGRTDTTPAPRPHPQLLSSPKAVLQRRGRGPEQQSQSNHEKILRIPHLPCPRTGSLPLTCKAAGA